MKIALAFCLFAAFVSVHSVFSDLKYADSKVIGFTARVQDVVEQSMKTQYNIFGILFYKEEVSEKGTTYLFKVKANTEYFHVKAFVGNSGSVSHVGFIAKRENDSLEDFI